MYFITCFQKDGTEKLNNMPKEERLQNRYEKYRRIGR